MSFKTSHLICIFFLEPSHLATKGTKKPKEPGLSEKEMDVIAERVRKDISGEELMPVNVKGKVLYFVLPKPLCFSYQVITGLLHGLIAQPSMGKVET